MVQLQFTSFSLYAIVRITPIIICSLKANAKVGFSVDGYSSSVFRQEFRADRLGLTSAISASSFELARSSTILTQTLSQAVGP